MKYKIENKISFNSEDKTLVNIDDDVSMLILSNVSSRLLHLFLCNPGQVLHRSTIFKAVWDDHGLVSSNNNLNHYVSQLRKDLTSLGLDKQAIITIPKVGFKLGEYITVEHEQFISQTMLSEEVVGDVSIENADVQLVTDNPMYAKPSVLLNVSEPASGESYQTSSRAIFTNYKMTLRAKRLLKIILYLLVAVSILSIVQHVKENGRELKKEYLFTVESCPVFSTNASMIADFAEKYRSLTELLIKENNIICKANQFLYTYYAGDLSTLTYDGQAFISLCGSNGDELLFCKSFYFYSLVRK